MEELKRSWDIELPYYLDRDVKFQLYKARKDVLENDSDRWYIIDGREGYGKTTLAFQLAYYLDPTICNDRIVFNSLKLEHKLKEGQKGQCVIYDEAFRGMSSKGAMSKENKRLSSVMQQCRQRNMFVFVVLPSIFLLEKYPAILRSHALFHVGKSQSDNKRRLYKCYNFYNKQLLYLKGKPNLSYFIPKITHSHTFFKKIPPSIDYKAYLDLKDKTFSGLYEEEEDGQNLKAMMQRDALLWTLFNKYKIKKSRIEKDLKERLINFGDDSINTGIKRDENRYFEQKQRNG